MSRRFRRPQPPKNFVVPQNNSGQGHTLKIGPWVSVYYDLQPPNEWPEHAHPVVQIVLSLGHVECAMSWGLGGRKRKTEIISEPCAWILGKNVPHSVQWRGTGTMIVLYVAPRYVREECSCDFKGGAVLRLTELVRRDFLIARLCQKFDDVCCGRRIYSEKLVSATAAVLAPTILNVCLRPGLVSRSPKRGLSDVHVQRIADYIDRNLRESLDRAVLANVVGLTVSHFSRMFKASTGMAPMQYVWRCRLHRARQLLESGEWKVTAVAAECGFCDQSHLIRQFRKEFNCLPGSVIPPGAER